MEAIIFIMLKNRLKFFTVSKYFQITASVAQNDIRKGKCIETIFILKIKNKIEYTVISCYKKTHFNILLYKFI